MIGLLIMWTPDCVGRPVLPNTHHVSVISHRADRNSEASFGSELCCYGQPTPGDGASAVSIRPVRVRSVVLLRPRHSLTNMNNVLASSPPSMQAKQPRSKSIVCSTLPPSRTRTQRLLGT